MKFTISTVTTTALLVASASAQRWGGWSLPSCASDSCNSVYSSAWDNGFQAFCTNSAQLASATSCIGNSNCDSSDKSCTCLHLLLRILNANGSQRSRLRSLHSVQSHRPGQPTIQEARSVLGVNLQVPHGRAGRPSPIGPPADLGQQEDLSMAAGDLSEPRDRGQQADHGQTGGVKEVAPEVTGQDGRQEIGAPAAHGRRGQVAQPARRRR